MKDVQQGKIKKFQLLEGKPFFLVKWEKTKKTDWISSAKLIKTDDMSEDFTKLVNEVCAFSTKDTKGKETNPFKSNESELPSSSEVESDRGDEAGDGEIDGRSRRKVRGRSQRLNQEGQVVSEKRYKLDASSESEEEEVLKKKKKKEESSESGFEEVEREFKILKHEKRGNVVKLFVNSVGKKKFGKDFGTLPQVKKEYPEELCEYLVQRIVAKKK